MTINVATLGAQGEGREHMEDYMWTENIPGDPEHGIPDINIFLIADGNGCHPGCLQAEQIVCPRIIEFLQYCIDENIDNFVKDPCFFMKLAIISSNQMLGGFKLGNEEKYAGYGVSLTISMVIADRIYMAHTGNTRLYIIRKGKLIQLTKDQTKGQQLVDEGKISEDLYYAHSDSRVITGGIGFIADPVIQTSNRKIAENDIFIMTTDGVHMWITKAGIRELVLSAQNCPSAADNIINAAADVLHSEDDMACIIFNIAP